MNCGNGGHRYQRQSKEAQERSPSPCLNRYYLLDRSEWGHREPGNVCIKRAPSSERSTGMEKQVYKSYDELPMLLTVSDVAAVLGVSRAGAYELARSEGSWC